MLFQRRFWRIQSIGWALAGAVIVSALVGLFSDGLLSRVRQGGGLVVEYQRFYRSGASSSFLVELAAGRNEIVLSNELAVDLAFETIRPTPARASAATDGIHFIFDASEGGTVFFGIRPAKFGRVTGIITDGESSLPIETFVYP